MSITNANDVNDCILGVNNYAKGEDETKRYLFIFLLGKNIFYQQYLNNEETRNVNNPQKKSFNVSIMNNCTF